MRIRCPYNECGTVMSESSKDGYVTAKCVKCGEVMMLTRSAAPLVSAALSCSVKLGRLGEAV